MWLVPCKVTGEEKYGKSIIYASFIAHSQEWLFYSLFLKSEREPVRQERLVTVPRSRGRGSSTLPLARPPALVQDNLCSDSDQFVFGHLLTSVV